MPEELTCSRCKRTVQALQDEEERLCIYCASEEYFTKATRLGITNKLWGPK